MSSGIGGTSIPQFVDEKKTTKESKKLNIREIPWVAMFTHPASLCLFLLNWVFGWIGFMLLTEMPAFLNDQLGYDLESSGLLSIAPYAANLISVILFAQLYDHLEVFLFHSFIHIFILLLIYFTYLNFNVNFNVNSIYFLGKERLDY